MSTQTPTPPNLDEVEIEASLSQTTRRGFWASISVGLSDGTCVTLRLPGVVSWSARSEPSSAGETASISVVDPTGVRRLGRLGALGL